MTKQVTKTAVPRLRFPEFEGSPHWTISKLGTRGRFLGGGTPSRENAEFWAGIHPWISSSDISDEEIRAVRPSRFITDEAIAQSATQVVPAGSVLIVARVGVGKVAVSEEQLHTSQDFANLVPSADSPTFLAYLLKSRKSALLAFNQGMAIKGFTRDDIAGLEVPIPEKSEQQKIADCLTSLDEVIAAQGRKVEALKAHKRGLMQQLFPREGETRPRLRFPEFRNAPGWTLGKASDIVDVLQGYGFPERLQGSREGEFPFYKVSDISACVDSGGILLDHANNHIDADVLGELRAKLVPVGSTVFAKIGEAIRSNKRAITSRPCLVDNNAAGVKAIIGLAHDRFVYYLWCQIPLIEYAGGVVPAVNKSAIEQIQVCYPKPDEQQRIADCLSSLDTRITAESRQLAALKTHKQGLMQQLFPAPEAAGA